MMNIKKGINIGNHFENEITTENFEYPIKDWYFKFIKDVGFDHVRLPVKWSFHCDDENGYKIHEEFAKLVDKAINESLANDLPIIINIHHFREAMDDPKGNYEKLAALWTQIAERYKDFSNNLIFEVFNEPTWRASSEDWSEVQNKLVKIIRKTNPTRKIMICGIDYSGLYKLEEIEVPENDKNLIGTFHYYFPVEFTHQGAEWAPTFKDKTGIEWTGSEEEVKWCIDAMKHAKDWSDKYGLPVNLGEFGAYSKADMASRCKWTEAVRRTAEAYGFSWSYWELCSSFGICKPDKPELIQPLADSLLKD